MAAEVVKAGQLQHGPADTIGQKLDALSQQAAAISHSVNTAASEISKVAQSLDATTVQLQNIHDAVKPPTGFFAQMQWPNWIQAALLLIAIATLWATRLALLEATKARDLENYHKLRAQFDDAWEKYAAAQPQDQFIVFGQLINLFESVCDLYNREYFGTATRDMLRSYLCQMLPPLWANTQTKAWIDQSITASDTFAHIKGFARAEDLAGVPHD